VSISWAWKGGIFTLRRREVVPPVCVIESVEMRMKIKESNKPEIVEMVEVKIVGNSFTILSF